MQIIIVDEKDNIIGYKERNELVSTDIYRVTGLWLTNSEGKILLAKRAANKKHHPNKWGPAVAGTVELGESYDDNIIKEASEEISLINIKFIKGPKVFINKEYIHFVQWYTAVVDKKIEDFVVSIEEVSELKWFDKQELENELKKNPDNFLPNLLYHFNLFI